MAALFRWIDPEGGFNVTAQTARLTRKAVVWNTTSEAEVHVAIAASADLVYLGLGRTEIRANPFGGGVWQADVDYISMDPQQLSDLAVGGESGEGGGAASSPSDSDALSSAYSWDTTGGSARIFRSLETRLQSGGAPETRLVIGASKDGPEGCDKVVPQMRWTRTVRRPVVKLPYMRTVTRLTGTVNDAPFYGYESGEVLYLGASGRCGSGTQWEITHNFAVQKNETDIDVGVRTPEGAADLIALKEGWEYVWVGYTSATDANRLLQRPDFWNVEVIFDYADFSQLEIGT